MSYDDDRRAMHDSFERLHGPRVASVVMDHLPPVGLRDVARTSDLGALQAGLRGEMAGLRGEVAGLRGEMAELRGEMAALRSELKGDVARLEGRIMRSQFTAAATASGLVVSAAGVAAAIVSAL